jgi:apolipoprotein N-acyltransferase
LYFLLMLRALLVRISHYYSQGNRWWIPLAGGLLYPLALPPFNHEFSPVFALFPFLSFAVLLPLFAAASQKSFRRALLHSFLFGFAASLGQVYWLIFDRVAGLWVYVIIAMFAAAAAVGVFYTCAGMLFRVTVRRFPRASLWIVPAIWVLIDYSRTWGDLAFPWSYLGYSFTPLLLLAQLASLGGVWGLTYIAVAGTMVLRSALIALREGVSAGKALRPIYLFAALLAIVALWGGQRVHRIETTPTPRATIALLQPDLDQFHWTNAMLDSSFSLAGSMMAQVAPEKPDLMILPESALLCYITHEDERVGQLLASVRRTGSPLIFGSLDWERMPEASDYRYAIFNAAFLVDAREGGFQSYHKIKLVPFSEAMPFEGAFPLLSRVNVADAGFHRGNRATVFHVAPGLDAAPLICYEGIFPGFVRERVKRGANLLVNITNDGWFGRSSGPYQHAVMERMRAIENGVSLVRSANSGFSMAIDPAGRVTGCTGLYERTTLTRRVGTLRFPTLYTRFGDWFPLLCAIIVLPCILLSLLPLRGRKRFVRSGEENIC